MAPAPLKKTRRNGKPPGAIDPYELVRRLSVVQAEETLKELERKRTDWETSLWESRDNQYGEVEVRKHTQPAQSVQPYKAHKRSASITLPPSQLPPPAYTDLPPPQRKQSLPSINRSRYTPGPRRPSLNRGDSALDLETIDEDVVVEPSLENLFPDWSMADRQRRRPSVLRSVSENDVPHIVSTQPVSRRRSSLLSQREPGRLDSLQTDCQPESRRHSSSNKQKRHGRPDWSQSDESPQRRRSSLFEKMGELWKTQTDQNSDAGDSDIFDSRASTLRNSWRSSMAGSTSSRRASMLKRVGDHWIVKPSASDDEGGVQDIHTDEEEPAVKHTKRVSGLFSKLRL